MIAARALRANRLDEQLDGEASPDNTIGGLLEAQFHQDLRDIKKLVMAWLGASERRRKERGERRKKKGKAARG